MKKTVAYLGKWGPYVSQDPVGVLIADYDAASGRFTPREKLCPEINCGQALADTNKMVLYYVNERRETADGLGGQVAAFRMDRESGGLQELARVPSFGLLPSYAALDTTGRFLLVTHHTGRSAIFKTQQGAGGAYEITQEYEETSAVLFPLDGDGKPGAPCDIVKFTGKGALPGQTNPHLHSVKLSPNGRFFILCDKGTDQVYTYRIAEDEKKLRLCSVLKGVLGSSPRYAAFHPSGKAVYYNNETKSVLNTVYCGEDGQLRLAGTLSCREDGCETAAGKQSDLVISQDGRYLYDILRDGAQIAVFRIREDNLLPERIQVVDCGNSEGGRGAALSPDGRFLHVAAGPDNGVLTYTVGGDGRLSFAFSQLEEEEKIGVITFVEL